MDQKREFIEFAMSEGANIRELCRRFRISPTGYRWVCRRRDQGSAGLMERSRRPKASPRRTAAAVEAKVLEVRDRSNNVWGGRESGGRLRSAGSGDPGGEHDH